MQQLDYSILLNRPNVGRQIQEGLMTGLQMQAYQAAGQAKQQEAEMLATQQQRQQEFVGALTGAKTPQEKAQLAAQFPEYLEQLKGVAGFQNDIHARAMGELALQIATTAESDPQAAAAIIEQNADVLRAQGPGAEPERLLELLRTDPAGLAQRADTMSLIGLGAKEYQTVRGQRAELGLKEQQLAETQNQNAFERDMRGKEFSLKQQETAIRVNDNRAKAIENQLKQEMNELKRQELQQKLDAARSKAEQAKVGKQVTGEGVISTAERGLELISNIRNSPGLSSAVGVPGVTKFLPGTDARETSSMIDTLKSQIFLAEVSKMKGLGALTEAEGRKLETSIASLDPSMPEKAFMRNLKIIEGTLNDAIGRAEKEFGVQRPQRGATGSFGDLQSMSTEDLMNTAFGGGR